MPILYSIVVLIAVCLGFYLGRLPLDKPFSIPLIHRKDKARVNVRHEDDLKDKSLEETLTSFKEGP